MAQLSSLFFLALPIVGGLIIGRFTSDPTDLWYTQLAKPGWTPPGWVFGPIWTSLYLAMGVSSALVWRSSHRGSRGALWGYFGQLACNFAWSPLFFGLHRPDLALLDLVALIAALIYTGWRFFAIDWRAGALLVPYLIWASCALVLNWQICQLNPHAVGTA